MNYSLLVVIIVAGVILVGIFIAFYFARKRKLERTEVSTFRQQRTYNRGSSVQVAPLAEQNSEQTGTRMGQPHEYDPEKDKMVQGVPIEEDTKLNDDQEEDNPYGNAAGLSYFPTNAIQTVAEDGILPSAVPDNFIDVYFSGGLLADPVMGPSGHSFERTHIEEWLKRNKYDPASKKELRLDQLSPNTKLKSEIEVWVKDEALNHLDDPQMVKLITCWIKLHNKYKTEPSEEFGVITQKFNIFQKDEPHYFQK